jgi:hypothetical protein
VDMTSRTERRPSERLVGLREAASGPTPDKSNTDTPCEERR